MVATNTRDMEHLFSERARRTGDGFVGGNPRGIANMIALGTGFPDPGSFPIEDLIETTRMVLERDGEWALQYAFGSGVPELSEQILIKLRNFHGIEAGPENLIITSGSSAALSYIIDMLVNPGDVVVTEAPWYSGTIHRVQASGADIREVPLDDDGINIVELRKVLEACKAEGKQAKLLYIVPNFQNPTGITTTLERRKEIVALAQEFDLPILEDDAYHDLRFRGEEIPTMYSLDDQGLVMYCGTFSKILSAGMRLGWCVASPQVIKRLSGLKGGIDNNAFTGHITAQFMAAGTLTEHITLLRDLYQKRRDAMVRALGEFMPEGCTWNVPDGGYFVWVTMPESVNCNEVQKITQERGVVVGMGSSYYAHGDGQNNLRLAYSYCTEEQITKGIQILGEVVQEILDGKA